MFSIKTFKDELIGAKNVLEIISVTKIILVLCISIEKTILIIE
jgi:hypothetical protein